MRDYIEQYLENLEIKKNISKNTRLSYERDLKRLMIFCIDSGVHDVTKIHYTHIKKYMDFLQDEGKADTTVGRHLVTLRGFFRYLEQIRIIEHNPCQRITAPKKTAQVLQTMSLEEVELFLRQPDQSQKGMRDRAMLEVLYATGIRVSEIIGLTLLDVNLPLSYIRCQNNKKARIIPMGATCRQAVEKYIHNTRQQFIRENIQTDVLFLNYQGKPLTRQGFWKIVKAYAKQAQIDKEITPHMLRHSFASHMVQNGADLNAVKEMMGHSDIVSTQRYLNHGNHKIKEEYLKAHPRA